MNVISTVAGITSAATIDVPQSRRNSTIMIEARMSPIRIASRTLLIDSVTMLGLIVERLHLERRAAAICGCSSISACTSFATCDRVAVRLAVDVEQHGWLAVGRDDRIHGLDARRDLRNISNADRNSGLRGLDYDLPDLFAGRAPAR